MKVEHFVVLAITLPFLSCGHNEPVEAGMPPQQLRETSLRERVAIIDLEAIDVDFAQRTCALFVAIRSASLRDAAAFDTTIDDTMVRWNVCDEGTMVACAKTPTANGDTLRAGIPWLHDVAPRF